MAEVTIYTKATCGYCVRAKELLAQKKQQYNEISIDNDLDKQAEMRLKSGRTSVPQIFIDGKSIGGCDDLYELENNGLLDKLLKG
jgi:glutaredoxin 3